MAADRRSSTPESPRPYPSFHPRTASLFPSPEPSDPPLSIAGVPDYIRQFNAAPSREARLHIWLSGPKEPRDLRVPLLLRFVIPDVLKAFIVLAEDQEPSDELASEIKSYVRNRLSAYAYPRKVEFVDELPKTASGKVQKFLLRDRIRALVQQEAGQRPVSR